MKVGNRLKLSSGQIREPRIVLFAAGILMLIAMVVYGADKPDSPGSQSASASGSGTKSAAPAQMVRVEVAKAAYADVPVYADGLGTVQAFYTVTVGARIDGELMKLGFAEGQMVKQGDMLAEIDPRPYKAAYDQAVAAKNKDLAQLANAKVDLARYVELAPQEFTSKQTLDTQRTLVAQVDAQIAADQAAIEGAKTQLDYTEIRSPITGITGIRLVDPGNIVHAAATTGIVVVTQVQPIAVIFTLPAESLQSVRNAMSNGTLTVNAISRDGKTPLGAGTVSLIDNQIDQTTGTMRVKAIFPNKEVKLWPGDFVNAHLLLKTHAHALTIPSAALQRGPNGLFVYVVLADSTVEMRPIKIAEESGGLIIVTQGLKADEQVTTSNQYRLQPHLKVQVLAANASAKKSDDAGAQQ